MDVMKKIQFLLAGLLFPCLVMAQFSTQGKITFERKTNLKMKYQTDEGYEWIKERIDQVAPFKVSLFTMFFNSEQSNYEFDKDEEIQKGNTFIWGKDPASENKVYTDFKRNRITAQKEIYENTYLLEDSIVRYQWKIEDEVRMIAGYPCRKAVTKIFDSVVVVAFYADQIMVSGGPESFGGLPGMILGLAIPRLYTTWFATNVELIPQEFKAFVPAKKTRKVTHQKLAEDMIKGTDDWGKYGAKLLWRVLL